MNVPHDEICTVVVFMMTDPGDNTFKGVLNNDTFVGVKGLIIMINSVRKCRYTSIVQ